MTYEQLIDKANLCIQAAIRCSESAKKSKPIGYGMELVWYRKASELRSQAKGMPV